MTLARENLLLEILSQPTAPYREGHVLRVVRAALDGAKVPYFQDPVGNLVIGVESERKYLAKLREKSREPLRVFMAHMDHPGFHGVAWRSSTELEIKWHGGSPVQHLEGVPVWLGSAAGWEAEGTLTGATITPNNRSIQTALVRLSPEDGEKLKTTHARAEALFGGFRFRAPVWKDGELFYTKAADDLVGAFAIVATALELWSGQATKKKKIDLPFIGLLTRAEEVGFIGAIGHFGQGYFEKRKRPVVFVSLETSRTLPGAEIGKGPVVRLGDFSTVFHAGALRVFTDLAEATMPGKYQRRIMDGGSCEATVAVANGLPALGISIPLGNYHNQDFQGGPDARGTGGGPAPEFVHGEDIAGMVTLCQALLKPKLPWEAPWKDRLKKFKDSFREARSLLREGP